MGRRIPTLLRLLLPVGVEPTTPGSRRAFPPRGSALVCHAVQRIPRVSRVYVRLSRGWLALEPWLLTYPPYVDMRLGCMTPVVRTGLEPVLVWSVLLAIHAGVAHEQRIVSHYLTTHSYWVDPQPRLPILPPNHMRPLASFARSHYPPTGKWTPSHWWACWSRVAATIIALARSLLRIPCLSDGCPVCSGIAPGLHMEVPESLRRFQGMGLAPFDGLSPGCPDSTHSSAHASFRSWGHNLWESTQHISRN